MKYAVLALALLVFLAACQQQQPVPQPVVQQNATPAVEENVTLPPEPAPVEEVVQTVAPALQAVQQFAPVNATLQACIQLEIHLNQSIDDAQTAVNRKEKEYERAKGRYDAAIDNPVPDDAARLRLRDAQDEAENAYEEAKDDYDDALKKRSKARQQCGLPDE